MVKRVNCLVIAGEKSGEEHAMTFLPDLLRETKEKDIDLQFFGVGGDLMKSLPFEFIYHLNQFSSWGLSEVAFRLLFYIHALKHIEREVEKRECSFVILIDFQEFNFELAKRLGKKGVKIIYYVAPQAWAWREYRAGKLGNFIHTLCTILPFEKKWFKDRGVKRVLAIPHPSRKKIHQDLLLFNFKKTPFENSEDFVAENLLKDGATYLHQLSHLRPFYGDLKRPLQLLLLPGSRNHEVERLLPLFMESAKELKKRFNIELLLVKSPSVREEFYSNYSNDIETFFDSSKLVMAILQADMAIAASGTVTLITALCELPTVVAYKISPFTSAIYKLLIRYKGPVSLANIVLGERVYPELLQERANLENVVKEVEPFLTNRLYFTKQVTKLSNTKNLIKGDQTTIATYIKDLMVEECSN